MIFPIAILSDVDYFLSIPKYMPELPEVQTVVSQLGKKITGKRLAGFWTEWPKGVKEPVAKLRRLMRGSKVIGTARVGKHVIIHLDNDFSLVIHLKMTGHLLYKDQENAESPAWRDPMNQFIRHRFDFADGSRVNFSDMRKFGWVDICRTADLSRHKHLDALGIDAMAPAFTLPVFETLLRQSPQRPIGTLLLDQAKIAGIGNIYRSEALFRAGILPWRKSRSLKPGERSKLFQTIRAVLREATRLRGTSDGDFRDTAGRQGSFQKTLYVYAREKELCKRCGTIIKRRTMGQRSVFYCPKCQH